jgi:pyruvate dehydrogenase E2 component (dihydrolipoamide acetyltransferase)
MADFTMPALGADMETGTVVQWLVQPGDTVKSGDVVAVVETHKGAIDVECFLDGVIEDLVPLNVPLPVGAVLARVRSANEAKQAAAPAAPAAPAALAPAPTPGATPPAAALTKPSPAVAAVAGTHARRKPVTPAARRRARQLGLDPAALPGTGVEGAVTLADVARATRHAPAAAPPAAPRRGFDANQMRQAIAAAMARSKREIPHYYLAATVEFTAAQAWLSAWNAPRAPAERLLPAVLLLKAVAKALVAYPQFNGFYENGGFRPAPGIHVGWAIAMRGGGLVAPAVHHADRKTPGELMAALRDLVQRARAGGLRSSEITDPSITVTSLGDRGADSVLGVIYPPQVAIVGFGTIGQRPWVADGQIVARPLVSVSLAADHRASDGHLGSQFLHAIGQALQVPESL